MTSAILLALGTAAALYIMVGYPLLLAVFPGRPKPKVAKEIGRAHV